MSGTTVGIVILMVLAILAAIIALEYKNLMISIISLIVLNFCIWIVFLLFNALLLAWIQLIVYGGGLTALFVVVVALTEKQTDETFDWKRTVIAAVSVAVIVGVLIWAIVAYGDVIITGVIGTPLEIVSKLWGTRTTDVILQGIIFFTTSIAIGTMFLQHTKKKHKEETKA
jgi:NADH-quinone oxidoreductase subunit J